MSQLWVGRTLGGRYKLDNLLGAGGMSAVYRAYDPNLRRYVAVKIIHPHLSEDPNFIERFKGEAAAVAGLRHPNIVQVHDFNSDGSVYYMVMDFLAGETLQARLRRLNHAGRHLPLDEAVRISLQVCDAAGYAHKHELIHRDIKPANIMLDVQGQAILMDFGIVKIIGGQYHTATGATVGTAVYMSPEQIRSERVDERSDIYSIGVMLFEMLNGRPPYEADSALTLMMMHLNDPVPDLRELREEIPTALAEVVEKALAKEPSRRYQTAAEMADTLTWIKNTLPLEPKATISTSAVLPDSKVAASGAEDEEFDKNIFTPTVADSALISENIDFPDVPRPESAVRVAPDHIPSQAEAQVSLPVAEVKSVQSIGRADISMAKEAVPHKEESVPLPALATVKAKRRPNYLWMILGIIIILLAGIGGAWFYIQGRPPAEKLIVIERAPIPITLETRPRLVSLGQWEVDSLSEELEFSPNMEFLAAASNRDWLRFSKYRFYASLWKISPGTLHRHLLNHINWVHSLSFSPDGTMLATSAEDERINLWQVQDGALIRTIVSGGGSVTSLDFSPNGKILAGSTWDGASIWQVSNGNQLTVYESEGSELSAVRFSHDGELLAGGSHGGAVFVWRVENRELLYKFPGQTGAIFQLAFSPDGTRLAAATADHSIKLWSMIDGKLIRSLEGHTDGVTGVAFSIDGSLLASTSWDNMLRFWHGVDGSDIGFIEAGDSILSLAFSSDGTLLATGTEKKIQFWGISEAFAP